MNTSALNASRREGDASRQDGHKEQVVCSFGSSDLQKQHSDRDSDAALFPGSPDQEALALPCECPLPPSSLA